jgi:hypothetical protein
MFLFTYPHIRKEKDRIPLTGLTPSCFSLPIYISGRRRIGYHCDMWIGKEKHEGVKPVKGILSFSFLICG